MAEERLAAAGAAADQRGPPAGRPPPVISSSPSMPVGALAMPPGAVGASVDESAAMLRNSAVDEYHLPSQAGNSG